MPGNKSQEARVLSVLIEAGGDWVSSFDLQRKSAALQYCSRVFGLKRKGFNIENRVEILPDGSRRGYYRLVRGVPVKAQPSPKPATPDALFSQDELEHCSPYKSEDVSRWEAALMRRRSG